MDRIYLNPYWIPNLKILKIEKGEKEVGATTHKFLIGLYNLYTISNLDDCIVVVTYIS